MRLVIGLIVSCFTVVAGVKLIRFGGGGIHFWWQAGAAQYILNTYDLKDVNVLGESAGSLVAALLACEVPFDHAADVAIRYV